MVLSNFKVQKLYTCLALVVFATAPAKAAELDHVGSNFPQRPQIRNGALQDNNPLLPAPQMRGKKPLLDMNKIFGAEKETKLEGPRTGGGGNSCALAITQNTQELMRLLKSSEEMPLSAEQQSLLKKKITQARFSLADQLILNGETKDAINYPDSGEIFLSQRFCQHEMIELSGRGMSLLLHEFLGLARIDDKKYQLSGQFMDLYAKMMDKHNRDKEFLRNELRKDLKGQKSCFHGEIREMKQSVWNYNIQADDFVIDVANAGTSNSKGPKECFAELDAKGNPVNSKYKICEDYVVENLVATISLGTWTSHDSTDIVRVFKVTSDTRIELKVDANASGLPSPEEIKDQKVKSTTTCKRLAFE